MTESIEDRLERIEKLLENVIKRLNRVEEYLKLLGLNDEVVSSAFKLTIAFSIPISRAIEAARRVIESIKYLGIFDAIDRSIIESLADCKARGVSEITKNVKVLRGTASRRIIRNRLIKLLERNVVIKVGNGKRPKYTLKACLNRDKE
ncbi:MAG: hypothetical protein B6U85_05250 [Desulfurococcales archaeon ex4484_42]|nr:MAG: hypothetical protein B6U85_05250 [Desulfurococcales archaeon ex4484_42]